MVPKFRVDCQAEYNYNHECFQAQLMYPKNYEYFSQFTLQNCG